MEDVSLALNNSRTYFMVSGIANAVVFMIGAVSVTMAGVATCGLGCLFIVLPLINVTVMIFDFIAISKIQQPPSPSNYSFLKMAAIFDMFSCAAIVPLIMGILNLQLLGRPDVHAYFHQGGGQS
jgi:hypothetical protein